MDLDLPPSARALHDEVLAFAEAELHDDTIVARDADGRFWREGWDRCARFGIIGLPVPREHGGRGATMVETIAAMEALGYACPDLGLIFAINAHLWAAAIPLVTFGTDAQRAAWLPGLMDGSTVAALAATEPGGGSDAFDMETRAERDGDDFVLDGAKTLVTNAPICDLAVVYAATTPGAGGRGITAFLVESSRDGMRRAARLDTMGLRTAEIGDIVLERCRVPADRVVGEVGGGAACFQCAMEWERGCILAMHLGRMRRQIERATDYARRRRQFGRPIGSFQSIANRIVDMKIRLDAARPLLYRVGARKDEGHGAVLEAAVAKIFLSDAAIASSEDAIQVFGGLGYTRPFEVERDLRDAIGARLYSGTSEIQRTLVARLIGLPSSTSPPPPPGGRLAPRTG